MVKQTTSESRPREGRRRPLVLSGLALLLASAGALAAGEEPADGETRSSAGAVREQQAELRHLLTQARRASSLWRGVESYYEREVAPIERVLLRYRDDPDLARRIARALVREARAVDLEPRLLLAVLLVENPWLDPSARSSVGARGLMQVMPLHRGRWSCEGELEDIEANICYGARIFAHYFRSSGGDVDRALLRYNGCVNGTNTPDCRMYPYHVFARAGRASVLAWLQQPLNAAPAAAAP